MQQTSANTDTRPSQVQSQEMEVRADDIQFVFREAFKKNKHAKLKVLPSALKGTEGHRKPRRTI